MLTHYRGHANLKHGTRSSNWVDSRVLCIVTSFMPYVAAVSCSISVFQSTIICTGCGLSTIDKDDDDGGGTVMYWITYTHTGDKHGLTNITQYKH